MVSPMQSALGGEEEEKAHAGDVVAVRYRDSLIPPLRSFTRTKIETIGASRQPK